MNFFQLLALSLSPGLAIILVIYFMDKYEHEPVRLLTTSFFYGCLSLVIVYYFSEFINRFITVDEESLTDQALYAFIVVSLVEETIKFMFIRGILYYERDFDEPFDGIVYAIMVGMGFATAENIVYVYVGGVDVAIMRMFSAVPAHATFAIIMGYFIGKAKFAYFDIRASKLKMKDIKGMKKLVYRKKIALGAIGLFCAVMVHGVYDYFIFISFVPGLWIGSVIALLLGIYFSKKAIDKQQETSPYRPHEKPKED